MNKLKTFGDRLKYLRNLLNRSRAYLAEKYNFPEITQKLLEYNERTASKKYLQKIIEIYSSESIYVTEQWLLKGTGSGPENISKNLLNNKNISIINSNDNNIIRFNKFIQGLEEITKICYPNSLVARTFKRDMEPIIFPGDYCIGWPLLDKASEKIVGEPCIVKLKNCDTLKIKILKKIIDDINLQRVNLSVTNIDQSDDESFIYNTDFEFISPIMCIIRKQNYEH